MSKTNGAKNKGGRPRIIESPEQFDRLVSEYAAECKKDKRPVTFSGLAFSLGFGSRYSLYDYAEYEGFSHSVKRAQLLIETMYEERLSGQNVAGAIFALKNHGWSDSKTLEHTGAGGGPIQTQDLTDDEVNERVRLLENRLTAYGGISGNGKG